VVLDRPDADITVTLSTGTHNIRKLYMRESLDIVGGALTINYVPSADSTPISAQFSGSVSLLGNGSLNVHTLQVDAQRTFTIASLGGALSANTINLMPHASAPAKILLAGNLNFNPLANAAAIIKNGSGAGASGQVDLGGETRTLTIGNGSAAIDLTISAPVVNGGLVKSGAGALALTGANAYAGDTAVQAGTLRTGSPFLADAADVFLTTGALLDLNFAGTDVIDSLFVDGASQLAGTWGALGSAADHTSPLITGSGLLQVTTYIAPLPPLPGDFDEDGVVDAEDLVLWQAGSGMSDGAPHPEGDANEDGAVAGADFLVWQSTLGSVQEPFQAAHAVPEPAAGLLIGAGLGALIARLRQRQASPQHVPLPRRG
jgi:autotransporter-associated beta strand protein